MPFSHLLLVLLVVVVWGLNFIFVKLGLNECPPLFLCAVRFFLACFPAILFIKPPKAPFKLVTLYGLVMFGLQFALLFTGMHLGMKPGMTSILMQTQVFFSMIFAAFFLKESLRFPQILGALVSFSGIILVAAHFDGANLPPLGFVLILAAAATWGVSNLITKKMPPVNMISLVVWGSFVATLPMFVLSFLFEGLGAMQQAYQHVSPLGIGSLLYIVYGSTWIGYGIWNWLLSRYPVNTIVPFSLLVPVVGVMASIMILNEPFELWKCVAGALVIGGLGIHLAGTRIGVRRLAAG